MGSHIDKLDTFFFFLFNFLLVITTLSELSGSARDFQAAFLRTFFCDTLDFVLLESDLFLLGEEALDPLLDPGLEPPLFVPPPDFTPPDNLLPFSFFPDPIRFFFVGSADFAEEDLEFCLPSLLGTDWECFGDIFFLVCLDRGLTWWEALPRASSGLDGDLRSCSCFSGDFFLEVERLRSLVLIGEDLAFLPDLEAASVSAAFSHCLIVFLTPLRVLDEEQGSLVHGLDSVRSRILTAKYLPH